MPLKNPIKNLIARAIQKFVAKPKQWVEYKSAREANLCYKLPENIWFIALKQEDFPLDSLKLQIIIRKTDRNDLANFGKDKRQNHKTPFCWCPWKRVTTTIKMKLKAESFTIYIDAVPDIITGFRPYLSAIHPPRCSSDESSNHNCRTCNASNGKLTYFLKCDCSPMNQMADLNKHNLRSGA